MPGISSVAPLHLPRDATASPPAIATPARRGVCWHPASGEVPAEQIWADNMLDRDFKSKPGKFSHDGVSGLLFLYFTAKGLERDGEVGAW